MKNLLLLAFITIIIAGCNYSDKQEYKQEPRGCFVEGMWVETIVIDSCEYIHGYRMLAHKGNCKYCQKRMFEQVKKLQQLKE